MAYAWLGPCAAIVGGAHGSRPRRVPCAGAPRDDHQARG